MSGDPDQAPKVLIVGDGAIGKTCLLDKFCSKTINWEDDPEYEPTTFNNFVLDWTNDTELEGILSGDNMQIEMWDTAGQEAFEQLRKLSYPGTSIYLVGYSTIEGPSLSNIQHKWVPELKETDPDPWIIIVGTKSDLRGTAHTCVSMDDIKAMCKLQNACAWVETSAKEEDPVKGGIVELKQTVAKLVLKKRKGEARPDWVGDAPAAPPPAAKPAADPKPEAATAATPAAETKPAAAKPSQDKKGGQTGTTSKNNDKASDGCSCLIA